MPVTCSGSKAKISSACRTAPSVRPTRANSPVRFMPVSILMWQSMRLPHRCKTSATWRLYSREQELMVMRLSAAALGPAYLKAVRSPISHVRIMAVGGINEKNAAEFLKAGAVGLGVGGNLANRQWIADGAFEKITQTAQALVAAVRTAE